MRFEISLHFQCHGKQIPLDMLLEVIRSSYHNFLELATIKPLNRALYFLEQSFPPHNIPAHLVSFLFTFIDLKNEQL